MRGGAGRGGASLGSKLPSPPRRAEGMLHSFAGGTQSKEQKLYEASKVRRPCRWLCAHCAGTATATTAAAAALISRHTRHTHSSHPPVPPRRTTCARRRSSSH